MFSFLKVLCVFILCSLQCFADQLDVYFFNVGQASFTLLKTDTHAAVIDCGTTRLTEVIKQNEVNGRIRTVKVHPIMKAKVDEILNDIKPTILISHMDSDHYCGLDKFFPKDRREKVVVGGIKNEKTIMPESLASDDVFFFENKINGRQWDGKNGEQQRGGEQNGGRVFGDILGGNNNAPSVTCFFPEKNDVSENGNEQSLMIKVTYAGRNILFPGDCSATLLEKLSKMEGFADFFKNIDVFVFSHHGDGHNGEFNLYGVVFDPSQERIPSFSIISSNPAGRNKIPKSEVLGFQYKTEKILKKAPDHPFDVYSLMKREVTKVPTSLPVYVTCNSRMAYKLMISPGGKVKVRNIGDNI